MNILDVKSIFYKPDSVSFIAGGIKELILKDVSFTLERGNILGIAGESGSGKTTLAKIIAGIIKASAGDITINKSIDWNGVRTSPVQILFQNTGDIINPLRIVFEVIEETASIRNKNKGDNKKIVADILQDLNFPDSLWYKKGFQLSGGEQQRAALARCIAARPELLLLDEPFSSQDPDSQMNFLSLFKKINKDYGISMICISHNLAILRDLCTGIIIMYKGEIVEKGKCPDILDCPSHPYTKFLLKAENYDLSVNELRYDPE